MDFVRNGEFIQYAVTCMTNISPHNAWTCADWELEAKAFFYLGRIYWVMGDLDEAQVLFKKSKASSDALFGSNHPWTLWTCNNLAIILTEQQKYAEACEYAELAFNGMTATFGTEQEETLIAEANLSAATKRQSTNVPSNPVNEEIDSKLVSARVESETPRPQPHFPGPSIPVDHNCDPRPFDAVAFPEQSAYTTHTESRNDEERELH